MSLRSRIASVFVPPGAPSIEDEQRYSLSDWIKEAVQYSFNGNMYTLPVTVPPSQGEVIENSFPMYVSRVYKQNGPAFAVIQARINILSETRFKYRNLKTKKLFGDPALAILETPWPNATTGELIARMEQDVSLCGNSYWYIEKTANRLRRMSPEKVKIILSSSAQNVEDVNDLNSVVGGYAYYENGDTRGEKPTKILRVDEVIHWSPIPDPSASYRGMSWLTPVVQHIQTDLAATEATQKFFDNGMTPNLVVKFPPGVVTKEQFESLRDGMEASHAGAANAYKTLYLAAGADATVVGTDLKTSGLRDVQGGNETRIAAAGSCPPICAGLKEGLEAATYSNYGQARRHFGDGFARPQWRSMCAALAKAVTVPSGAELWYDDDIPYLREDAKDAADEIVAQTTAITTLVNGGFEADSVVNAVQSGDLSQLVHTGLLSVQLQDPTAEPPDPAEPAMKPADMAPAPEPQRSNITVNLPEQHFTFPETTVHVEPAQVNVEAPPVPEVTVNVEAARAPDVVVEAAQIHVDGPVVNIPEQKNRSKVVTRDDNGEIVRVDEVDV